MKFGILALAVSLFTGSNALAYDRLPGDKYYTYEGTSSQSYDPSPLAMMVDLLQPLAGAIDLLKWKSHNSEPPLPNEKYSRKKHFAPWFDMPDDDTCYTTRGIILVRESSASTEVIPEDPCFIQSGKWFDPYTKKSFTEAKDVQIDHLVPLKEAYVSGAYKWDWNKRCSYSNFMYNQYHLRPVEGKANTKKSDNGPDRWMPPNEAYACEYVANWLRVKAIWKLMMSDDEVAAIQSVVREHGCDKKDFILSEAELNQARSDASALAGICPPPAYFDGLKYKSEPEFAAE